MTEHKSRVWAFGISLLLGLAGASLTACNNSQQENTASGLMGRLTSVSDTKVVVEVFERPSNAASGAAVDGSRGGKRPEGTPPADFKQGEIPEGERPDGTPPADFKQGEKPEGDRPDMKQDDQKEGRPDSENGRKQMKGESKTFVLTEDTKIYKQEGEEQTEISADELELGSMLSVVADGDTAETITVQSRENWQKRGDS